MSVWTALSGLQSNSTKMNTISSNIANGNTVGGKRKECHFSSEVIKNTGDGTYVPGGVRANVVNRVQEQGIITPSSTHTDMAISGKGFFLTAQTLEGRTGAQDDFGLTRAPASMDKNGYFRVNGNYLMGWKTDEKGDVDIDNTQDIKRIEPVKVSKNTGINQETSNISLQSNLPSDDAINDTRSTKISIYDSLGKIHDLNLKWTKTADSTWDLNITTPDGVVKKDDEEGETFDEAPLTTIFDPSGNPKSFGGDETPPKIYIKWNNLEDHSSTLTADLGSIGQNDGLTSRAGEFSIRKVSQDGLPFGEFERVSFNNEGLMTAHFNNGLTKPMYKVALANVASPDQMEEKSGNLWMPTLDSGDIILGGAKQDGFGSIATGSTEASTIDIAEEFTKIITAQRGYSANARVIRADEENFKKLEQIG